ncbi:toxin-antitoxin system YwqK family antitoxin [Pedobacter sp. AW1-32]|uniref:toxin-antitoxin system YwqK family antitoxin n=1 Tax=Pedobacter sp. AW1-32 TaxID=3383026 RepID=UPI003FF0A965
MLLSTRLTVICFLFISVFSASAQKQIFDISEYSHTINYEDHKAVFHIQSTDQKKPQANVERIYYWYSGNQIRSTQGGFSGKLLNGLYNEYFLTKNLKEQGNFKMGLKDGLWSNWFENGHLSKVVHFKKGILQGAFEKYSDSGYVMEKGRYINGQLSGKITRYFAKDSIQVFQYKNGILVQQKPSRFKKWIPKFLVKKDKKKDEQETKPR